MNTLIKIQNELKAPKNQRNNFGNYNYRSTEDILEALKPILLKYNHSIIISDDIINIADRFYVKATISLLNEEGIKVFETSAYAREELAKKGMDASQITGSASSYARKYALNGMFCIDDTKDADATNTHGKDEIKKEKRDKPVSAESRYVKLLKEKGMYEETLHINFNRMSIEEQRKEYKRVLDL